MRPHLFVHATARVCHLEDDVVAHSRAGDVEQPSSFEPSIVCSQSQLAAACAVEVVQLLALGKADYARADLSNNLRLNALFVGPGVRKAVNAGAADYTPVFLSEIPALFENDATLPLDAALVQVSPPDEHGFCSFGVSVDIVKPAAEQSRTVVAEVNAQMPRTLGDCFIHVSKLTYAV